MAKIELKYMFNEVSYTLEKETNSIKIFINEYYDTILITDKNNEIIQVITAGCGQNQGFLRLE